MIAWLSFSINNKIFPCCGIMFDAKRYKAFIELDVENEQMVLEISREIHKHLMGTHQKTLLGDWKWFISVMPRSTECYHHNK